MLVWDKRCYGDKALTCGVVVRHGNDLQCLGTGLISAVSREMIDEA